MKVNADLTKVLGRKYDKMWVALSKDRSKVIDSSDTLSGLQAKLGEKRDKVIFMKVLPSDMEFAFAWQK
jgi:hypothetical protein